MAYTDLHMTCIDMMINYTSLKWLVEHHFYDFKEMGDKNSLKTKAIARRLWLSSKNLDIFQRISYLKRAIKYSREQNKPITRLCME